MTTAVSGPNRGAEPSGGVVGLMGFQGDDDIILGPGLGRVVGAKAIPGDAFLAVDEQLEAVFLHRRQMLAARDQGNIMASQR